MDDGIYAETLPRISQFSWKVFKTRSCKRLLSGGFEVFQTSNILKTTTQNFWVALGGKISI